MTNDIQAVKSYMPFFFVIWCKITLFINFSEKFGIETCY